MRPTTPAKPQKTEDHPSIQSGGENCDYELKYLKHDQLIGTEKNEYEKDADELRRLIKSKKKKRETDAEGTTGIEITELYPCSRRCRLYLHFIYMSNYWVFCPTCQILFNGHSPPCKLIFCATRNFIKIYVHSDGFKWELYRLISATRRSIPPLLGGYYLDRLLYLDSEWYNQKRPRLVASSADSLLSLFSDKCPAAQPHHDKHRSITPDTILSASPLTEFSSPDETLSNPVILHLMWILPPLVRTLARPNHGPSRRIRACDHARWLTTASDAVFYPGKPP